MQCSKTWLITVKQKCGLRFFLSKRYFVTVHIKGWLQYKLNIHHNWLDQLNWSSKLENTWSCRLYITNIFPFWSFLKFEIFFKIVSEVLFHLVVSGFRYKRCDHPSSIFQSPRWTASKYFLNFVAYFFTVHAEHFATPCYLLVKYMNFDESYVDRHLTIWEFGFISQKAQRLRSNFNVNKDRRYNGAEIWCWSRSDLFLEYIFLWFFYCI